MTKRILPLIMTAAIALAGCSSSSSSKADSKVADKAKSGEARITITGDKFYVGDKEWWCNGVNTPWDSWNDFGGNYNEEFWDGHFQKLQDSGVNCSRIWINCDGNCAVKLNDDGSFLEVSDKHWEDLDSLFEIAQKHEIYLMPTLISFDHFKEGNANSDKWRAMVQSETAIDSFVDGYVAPLVERYKDNDYFFAIDLINEPDWVYENAECGKIAWDNLSMYFGKAAAQIHKDSDVLVTTGLAMVKYNSDSYEGNKISDEYLKSLTGDDKAFMDFNSTHYYNWEKQWFKCPFEMSPAQFGLTDGKPALVGETAANDFNESKLTLSNKYNGAYDNGWCGVMAWTSNGVDACGGLSDVTAASTDMMLKIYDLIYPNANK